MDPKTSLALGNIKQLMDSIMTEQNVLYVICPDHVGDFLINGCFCHALQKMKRKKSCVLIACDKLRTLNIDFVGVSDIIYVPQKFLDLMKCYTIMTSSYETDKYFHGHFREDENHRLLWNRTLCFLDRFRQNVFSLPLGEPLVPPIIHDIDEKERHELHKRYQIDKKTIILMPHAYTIREILHEDIWIRLHTELQRRGYQVYTNVAGNELPIKGTLPLHASLPELFYIAGKIHCFIALRSGVLDFLTFSKAKILCILVPEAWYYDLSLNYPDCNSKSYYYIGCYRKEIESFMQQNNITDFRRLNFASEHVDAAKLYLEDESLIDAILQDVDSIPSIGGATA